MLIDTHCHLDATEFDADRDASLAAAQAVGVERVLVPAVDAAGFVRVRALAARHGAVRCALGIHPLYVHAAEEAHLAQLEAELSVGACVAVGEIGLDAYVENPDLPRQTEYFAAQLKLARRFDLPVVLHIRRAQDLVLQQLRRHPPPGGIAHAFNGSRQQAEAFIKLGFRLGFGGAMTFAGSKRIRELAATLPLTAIVLETDAPDMAPVWAQGERNESAQVARYARELAGLRGISVEEVIAATGANACEAVPGLR